MNHIKFLPVLLFFAFALQAQQQTANQATQATPYQQPSAAEIHQDIKKLQVIGSALYLAAHPDDENTRVISYLANRLKVKTAYLSLTRGDGGQNRIGPEIRELLGVIRTQELLKARSIDGGEQFFSRANDFSYSKNAEETFTIWDREQVLHDAVWVIRKFRPEVLITRFPHTPSRTHGHHTAASQIAYEAFDAAADPKRFPEQLNFVSVWQPKRLVWNAYSRAYASEEDFQKASNEMLQVDVGSYYPLLGKSNNEIAGISRSQHQCQAMGTAQERGSSTEYFEHLKGERAENGLFDGVATSWTSIEHGGKEIQALLDKIDKEFQSDDPAASIPNLLKVRDLVQQVKSNWKATKMQEINDLIVACAGLHVELIADEPSAVPGDQITATLEMVNRSSTTIVNVQNVRSKWLVLTDREIPAIPEKALEYNVLSKDKISLTTEKEMEINRPYWLKHPGTKGMYTIYDKMKIGGQENTAAITVQIDLLINNKKLSINVPLIYRRLDPVIGEVYRPFVLGPAVSVSIKDKIVIFAEKKSKTLETTVKAGHQGSGTITIQADKGWTVSPSSIPYDFKEKNAEQKVNLTITPPGKQSTTTLNFVINGKKVMEEFIINYPHIPEQQVYLEAKTKLVRLDIQKRGERIGYYMGAGDKIPTSLEQIGYKVTLLDDASISKEYLKQFDAVIIGIRAYNTSDRIPFHQPLFMDYVKNGGTMIVQYNTSFRLKTKDIGPYPLTLSTDRTTVEEAEVRLLLPDHPVLNFPNKITAKDFEGWVQERGLYFPNAWDDNYKAILSSNDPGETPKDGGLLVAEYGKGHYIYTGYSWFRELPAGVPGAFRFYANLISLGN